jgi:putative two-component system response regulator
MIGTRVNASSKKQILVVDDDEATTQLLCRLLESDYDVACATSSLAAVQMLRRNPLPALVLLDVNMPKFNGFVVARNLRAIKGSAGVPIIFLSASNRPADVIESIQHGAKHYITKPFNAKELLGKIKKAVRP